MVTLLDTCGAFFDRGAARAKLDRFLAYFQRYVLSKPALPIDQAFDVADLFTALRPKMVRHERFEDACAAWIYAGGAHHSAFSSAVTVEHLEDFAAITGIEMIRIGEGTTIATLKNELRWNDIAYHLLQGVGR